MDIVERIQAMTKETRKIQTDRELVELLQMRLTSIQVHAPACFTDEEIETIVNENWPTGISSPWTILRDGPDPVRVVCDEDSNAIHVVLVCWEYEA